MLWTSSLCCRGRPPPWAGALAARFAPSPPSCTVKRGYERSAAVAATAPAGGAGGPRHTGVRLQPRAGGETPLAPPGTTRRPAGGIMDVPLRPTPRGSGVRVGSVDSHSAGLCRPVFLVRVAPPPTRPRLPWHSGLCRAGPHHAETAATAVAGLSLIAKSHHPHKPAGDRQTPRPTRHRRCAGGLRHEDSNPDMCLRAPASPLFQPLPMAVCCSAHPWGMCLCRGQVGAFCMAPAGTRRRKGRAASPQHLAAPKRAAFRLPLA